MTPKVELWFVRHGESHNNKLLSGAGGLSAVTYPFKFQQDPFITSKGISVAQQNGERLVAAEASFDIVLSSAMVRTIETSFYMFVKSGLAEKIKIAPFISEIPLRWAGIPIYENIPLERREQIKKLGKSHGSELLDAIDWSYVGGANGDNKKCLPPNGDNFLDWLHGLEDVKSLQEQYKDQVDKVIRIAVVTHSHLMKRDTIKLGYKPDNADILIAGVHVMPTDDGKDILTLTDMKGWYQEKIAVKREEIEKRIQKTEVKETKNTEKYDEKVSKTAEKIQGKIEKADVEGEKLKKIEKLEAKAVKKEEKYKNKEEKRASKYGHKKEILEEQKKEFINISDIQTAQVKANGV